MLYCFRYGLFYNFKKEKKFQNIEAIKNPKNFLLFKYKHLSSPNTNNHKKAFLDILVSRPGLFQYITIQFFN